jgi:hypothetical protein
MVRPSCSAGARCALRRFGRPPLVFVARGTAAAVACGLAALLGAAAPAAAQQRLTEHTLTREEGAPRPAARVDDVAWIAGHWQGDALGGRAEEVWSPPFGPSMLGMFKHVRNGVVTFYEIMHIAPDGESLILRIKHFNADLTGWEAQDETVDFPLVRLAPGIAHFDGLTFTLVDDDTLVVHVATRRAERVGELEFRYRRLPPAGTGS